MGHATDCFSKRLKEVREAAGLTQAQLASELEVSRGAISYYEKGERTPDIEFFTTFAEYFNLPLEFAMGCTDNIKVEHRNMYELYGLTDDACGKLELYPEIGHLISAIIEHRDFYVIENLYCSILENYKTFDISQLGYISFLISDALNEIICDSLSKLHDMQFTAEEKEALRIRKRTVLEKLKEIEQQIIAEDSRTKRHWEEQEEKEKQQAEEKNAIRYSAQNKVYEEFMDTVNDVESHKRHRIKND